MNETAYGGILSSRLPQAVNAKSAQPNFADAVSLANERVATLVSRLDGLANRLCGSVSQDASGGPTEVPNGLLSEVMDRASDIAMRADAGLDMLNRIERALP